MNAALVGVRVGEARIALVLLQAIVGGQRLLLLGGILTELGAGLDVRPPDRALLGLGEHVLLAAAEILVQVPRATQVRLALILG